MSDALLEMIDAALTDICPSAAQSFEPAVSIERQLKWCRDFVQGNSQEDRPGPFSMGLIATREFDMYGDQPELAALINEVQGLIEAKLRSC